MNLYRLEIVLAWQSAAFADHLRVVRSVKVLKQLEREDCGEDANAAARSAEAAVRLNDPSLGARNKFMQKAGTDFCKPTLLAASDGTSTGFDIIPIINSLCTRLHRPDANLRQHDALRAARLAACVDPHSAHAARATG